jgi:ketosteroid isomerase-like protein
MKRFLFVAFAFFTIEVAAQPNDETAVRRILNDQSAAWNRGDIESFMKGYWENDSLMFIGKSGITYGWVKTLDNYKKNYPDTVSMGKLAFTIISAKNLSAEYFYVIGKWHLRRTIGNLEGHFTLLFKKINGQWVIVADHSS